MFCFTCQQVLCVLGYVSGPDSEREDVLPAEPRLQRRVEAVAVHCPAALGAEVEKVPHGADRVLA